MKENSKVLIVPVIALLLVALIAGTYAYFASNREVSNTLNVVANIEHDNGSFITTGVNIELNVTSANMQEKVANTIAATATGNLNVEYLSGTENGITCKYDINYEWVSDNDTNPYTLTNSSKNEFTYKILDGSNVVISERNFVASSDRTKQKLGTGYIYNASDSTSTIKNYNISAKFYNIDENQSVNADKNWLVKFYIDNVVCGVNIDSTYTLSGVLLDNNGNPISNGTIMTHSENRFTTTDNNGAFTISGLENESHEIFYLPNTSIVDAINLSSQELNNIAKSGTFTPESTGTINLTDNYSVSINEIAEISIRNNNVNLMDSCPDCKYIYTSTNISYGDSSSIIDSSLESQLQNDYKNLNSKFFLGLKINNTTKVVEKAYACGIAFYKKENEQAFCIEGKRKGYLTNDIYISNRDVLFSIFGTNTDYTMEVGSRCSDVYDTIYCEEYENENGEFLASFDHTGSTIDGQALVYSSRNGCGVYNNGTAKC